MALGVPVVATGYSGNLDFMSDADSLLVPYQLVPVAPGSGSLPDHRPGGRIPTSPSPRTPPPTVRRPGFAAELGTRGRDAVLAAGDLGRAAAFVRDRLEAAAAEVAADPARFSRRVAGSTAEGRLQRARTFRTPLDVHTASRLPFGVAAKLRTFDRAGPEPPRPAGQRAARAARRRHRGVDGQADHRSTSRRVAEPRPSRPGFGSSRPVDGTSSQIERLDVEQIATPYMSRPDVLRHRRPGRR